MSQQSLMRYFFLFIFHQLVDASRKFANSASKIIMLRYNRISRLQEKYLFPNKAQYVNSKAVKPGFCVKMEVTRVPPGRPSRTTTGTRTTGWEPCYTGTVAHMKNITQQ